MEGQGKLLCWMWLVAKALREEMSDTGRRDEMLQWWFGRELTCLSRVQSRNGSCKRKQRANLLLSQWEKKI